MACLVLLGCGEREPAPRGEPVELPRGPDEPAPPAGAAPARCEGRSVDPPPLDLLSHQADEGDLAGAIEGLEALAGAHPGSATARVRLGELLLRVDPPEAARAQRWFERGLALHEARCTLGDRDLWAALEGSALSRFMQDDYGSALPFLRRSLEAWPGARASRYNLACALCRTGDLEGCGRELGHVLRTDVEAPDFLAESQRPTSHYRELASRDPDLAPLRADAARWAAVYEP